VTAAVERWSAFVDPAGATAEASGSGTLVVWRLEMVKLARQIRVQGATALCILAPFIGLAAVKVQGSVPSDTLFGQWLHESGFALPMVVVAGAGVWVLPVLTAIVSGDIFSSEDHFGTWKTVLTRSRSRGQLFRGKVLAALTYTTAELIILTLSSVVAGFVLGSQPVVGLSGQLVPAGHATALVLETWGTQLAPLLGFCALGLLLSVVTRNSVVGVGGPILLGLVMGLAGLVNIPYWLNVSLLSTGFDSWHGLWVQVPFYGPLREGLVVSAVWFAACLGIAWLVFRRRTFGAT
jgi:ABC-2 type transport system permease protein